MKKMFMCIAGAMMVLSLAACTPTTEKTEESVGQIETTAPGGKEDKVPDADAPVLEIVSVYHLDDAGKTVCEMDGVEHLDIDNLVDKMIEYGVLNEGTSVDEFTTEGESEKSQEAGPGAKVAAENAAKFYDSAVLDLSEDPLDIENVYQLIANTVCENLNVTKLTIKVSGEEKAADLKVKDLK